MLNPIRLSDVREEQVRYLMPDRIPFGAITVLEGDPGTTKSTLCYEIAARLTMSRPPFGFKYPVQAKPPKAFNAILLQAEDDVGSIIGPNLKGMGADLERIFVYDKRALAEAPISFPDATSEVQRLIEHYEARLLVIDPISSFVAGSVNNDQSVRRALSPLAAIAAKTGTAVVLVRHLSKGEHGKSLYRGAGSIALAGIARSVLRVVEDPYNRDRRLLLQIKSNLNRCACSMRYRIERGKSGVQLKFLGFSQNAANELDLRPQDRPAMEEAKDFLCSLLGEGELGPGQIKRAALNSGISERTLRRAKEELGVQSRRDGFGPGSKCLWKLNLENDHVRAFMQREAARSAADGDRHLSQ